jgi:hypothetical protein
MWGPYPEPQAGPAQHLKGLQLLRFNWLFAIQLFNPPPHRNLDAEAKGGGRRGKGQLPLCGTRRNSYARRSTT